VGSGRSYPRLNFRQSVLVCKQQLHTQQADLKVRNYVPTAQADLKVRNYVPGDIAMLRHVLSGTLVAIGATIGIPGTVHAQAPPQDPFASVYRDSCSACHGENLEGAAQGPALAGSALRHGDSIEQITKSIAAGFPDTGMPAWSRTLDAVKIQRLAILIAEKRGNLAYTDFKVAALSVIPDGVLKTEAHSFRIETVASGLDRLPYSIAPLPDGQILITEKTRGLRLISRDGTVSDLIKGTPQAYNDGFEVPGIRLVYGMGYLMDVAPHPDYARNGWIYLHYTDRCSDCNDASRQSKRPVSANAVVRGRIKHGTWVDQQPIWRSAIEHYTGMPDMAAGGRLAFDGKGHVFFSVGIKGGSEYAGIQDLSLPFGKIHRVNDDGTIPSDNPFVGTAKALPSIWTYGHRSPQGLEFNRATGQLWETEMGQRGGDEVNLLLPGRNYGWPLVSKGLKYDGTPVDYGTLLKIEPDLQTIQQPVVDLTPSPAVSSFIVYEGKAFPRWRRNLLVGSLKATELYRMVLEGDRVVHRETLVKGLGRIRDVTAASDGVVYLLIEHASGGRIVRLVPAN
jgi:aldose sugar dehydrogenase